MTTKQIVVSFDLDSVLYPFVDELGRFLEMDFQFDVWDLGLGKDRMKQELRRFAECHGFLMGKPLLNPDRIKRLQSLGVVVIYCTARREEERHDTQAWLDAYDMSGQLYMSNWKGLPTLIYDHRTTTIFGLDDKPSNVTDMISCGMLGYLADFPFSKQFQEENPSVPVVRDAAHFCDIVEGVALGVSW